MKVISALKSLCLPSKVYLALSLVGEIISVISPSLFMGTTRVMHLVHLVYIVFWTWILHLICRAGYKWISWVLVLAPFVAMFILFTFVLNGAKIVEEEQKVSVPVVVLNQ
jgi:hypothetical protein